MNQGFSLAHHHKAGSSMMLITQMSPANARKGDCALNMRVPLTTTQFLQMTEAYTPCQIPDDFIPMPHINNRMTGRGLILSYSIYITNLLEGCLLCAC